MNLNMNICDNSEIQEFKIDSEFSSLVELENSLNNYEAKHYCNFTKSNSRTIEGAKKKGLKRYINPKLEYAEIDYVCVNGGQYKTQSKGIRSQQSSYRSKCPVVIRIRPDAMGEKLVIKSFVSEHNHICTKAMYDHYPKQRRLDNDAKINAWEQDKNITTTEIDSLLKENKNRENIDVTMEIEEIEEDNTIQIDANMEKEEIEEDNIIQTDNLENNLPHLPPRVPKRGRPKGKDKTVIGVLKKRRLTSKLLPFEGLPVNIRHYEMLRWFVDDGIAKSAVYENKHVHEEDVEVVPQRVSNAVIDKSIAIEEIKCYLTEGSWLAIQQVIKMKKLTPTWICPICAKDAATKSICCNRCLEWSHLICVRVNANFKSKLWFCNFCKVTQSNTNLKNTT